MNREELDAYYAKIYKPPKLKLPRLPSETSQLYIPPQRKPTFGTFDPKTFKDYVGQESAKSIIDILLGASVKENRDVPNILLTGTAGLGKTTLAKLIYKETECIFVDGNAFNSIYSHLSGPLIIDEIHNVKPDVCDSLNVLLDDKKLAVIGCTTNPGLLPSALRSRFHIITLTPYSISDLMDILRKAVKRKKSFINGTLLEEIARRSRSSPRRTLQYLSFVLDMMLVNDLKVLTTENLESAFTMIGVDENGLLEVDHRYLACYPDDGRAVGLQYLAARLSADKETIEEEIEPYLMQLGYIDRTSKGRKRLF